jgi:hypothetical protein
MTPRANWLSGFDGCVALRARYEWDPASPARRVFVAVGKLGNPCQLAGILEGVLRL